MNKTLLKPILQLRQESQELRIRTSNRLNAIIRGVDEPTDDPVIDPDGEVGFLVATFKKQQAIETELDRHIEKNCRDVAVVQAMRSVRGVGSVLAAKLYCLIDIEKCSTVSALWKWAGLDVVDGKASRITKGEKIHHSPLLKTTMFILATSFIKTNSPYRKVYDEAKAKYMEREGMKLIHAHKMAMRKMTKLFLAHLYEVWRTLEGLPTREPYVFENLGHTTKITAEVMGWEVPQRKAA